MLLKGKGKKIKACEVDCIVILGVYPSVIFKESHSFLSNCACSQGYLLEKKSSFNSVFAPSRWDQSRTVSVSLKCRFKGIVVSEQQL